MGSDAAVSTPRSTTANSSKMPPFSTFVAVHAEIMALCGQVRALRIRNKRFRSGADGVVQSAPAVVVAVATVSCKLPVWQLRIPARFRGLS